jgi:hypothetical protein
MESYVRVSARCSTQSAPSPAAPRAARRRRQNDPGMGGPGQRPSQLGPNGVAIEAGELLDVLEHPDTLQNEDDSDA